MTLCCIWHPYLYISYTAETGIATTYLRYHLQQLWKWNCGFDSTESFTAYLQRRGGWLNRPFITPSLNCQNVFWIWTIINMLLTNVHVRHLILMYRTREQREYREGMNSMCFYLLIKQLFFRMCFREASQNIKLHQILPKSWHSILYNMQTLGKLEGRLSRANLLLYKRWNYIVIARKCNVNEFW